MERLKTIAGYALDVYTYIADAVALALFFLAGHPNIAMIVLAALILLALLF